jgi:hypothetical protein
MLESSAMNLIDPLKHARVWKAPSVIVLILANLVPLAGVLLFGWEVFPLLLLFWLENVWIGALNVLKMLLAAGGPLPHAAKLVLIPFFCVHYGGFTAIHGVFVFALVGGSSRGVLPDFDLVVRQIAGQHLWLAVSGLALSHAFSFGWNYLRGGEYRTTTVDSLMTQPYGRVMVLHGALIGGGFLILALGSPAAALALLVILKIALDVAAHAKQHALGRTTRLP